MVGVKYQNIVVQPATILHLIGNAIVKAFGLENCDHRTEKQWKRPYLKTFYKDNVSVEIDATMLKKD